MRIQDSPIGSFSNERNSIRKDVDRSVAVVVRVLFALSNKLRGRRITEVERDYTTWIASRRGKRKISFSFDDGCFRYQKPIIKFSVIYLLFFDLRNWMYV